MNAITINIANAERIAAEVIAEAFAPPPEVDYLDWAENNIVFSKRESPFPGPYNRKRFPFFDEILKALSTADPCRIVTVRKSAQLGGTALATIFVLGSLDMDPGDFMFVHPTLDNAKRWSNMKLVPMLKQTEAMRKLFPQKSRDRTDNKLYKERVDGRGALLISGANSAASLSQVTISKQVQDDLAKWETNDGGDPETQADSRARGIEFAKILKISTPLIEPGCRISKNFKLGSQERLHLPCPQCGHMQVLEWENFLLSIEEEAPEIAHFTCTDPECGGVIAEHDIPKMLERAEWIADNPSVARFHRSFDIWSAVSPLQSFERMAREWLSAKGDPASEQTFMNDTVGRPYKALGDAPPWETLRDRGAASHYAVSQVPAGYFLLFCGVDCQKDYVQYQVVAYSKTGRAIVESGVLPGHITEDKCQEALNGLLKQPFVNSYGRKLTIDLLAIDGNAWTEDVWGWAKKHPVSNVIMVRGSPSEQSPLIALMKKERNRRGKIAAYSKRFFNFNTSVLKMALYRNLAKEDPAQRNYICLPRGLEDEFYKQLTAETRREEKDKRGQKKYAWYKDPNQLNEGMDTHLQAEVAAIKFGVRHMPDTVWERYEAERECAPEPEQGDLEDLFSPGMLPPEEPQPKPRASEHRKKTNKWARR